MDALAVRVLSDLRQQRLVRRGERVAVALSGGPDSVALTLLLRDVLPELGADLVGAGHLHHGLRGAAADEDEAFCRAFADVLGLDLVVEREDVAARRTAEGGSIELSGHRARHAFYGRLRRALGADRIATGHTRNDVAETVLMRAIRGTGSRGLAAIRPLRPGLVRPLLGVTRPELLAFLAARGQGFQEDASNRDRSIPRNRVRHDLLPWLEAHLSPRAVDALARTAELARADDDFLRATATEAARAFVQMEGERLTVPLDALAGLPLAVRRRVALEVLERVSGAPGSAAMVGRLLDATARSADTVIRLGRVVVEVAGSRLVLWRTTPGRPAGRDKAGPAGVGVGPLPVPGLLDLPGGAVIQVTRGAMVPAADQAAAGADEAVLDQSRVREPLGVRFWRPGDWIRPLGMAGRKKLQDLFVDRKVPRHERDGVPIVVDADDRILWVAGHVVTEEARVTSATTGVLLFQYRRRC